jgi:hypothetical protein
MNFLKACVYSYFWHNDDDPISDNIDINGRLQTLDFINCYFSNYNSSTIPPQVAERCINDIFEVDTWPMIDVCARTSAGEGLYAALKEKVDALSPSLTYTPWVTIENIHRPDAESDLVNAVCSSYNV